jgi:DDE superfamily endonuclease
MKDTRMTLKMKVRIVNEAIASGNICGTARKYKIFPKQIHYWRKNINRFLEAIRRNPKAKTTNEGRKIQKINVEQDILLWINELRSKDIAVNTRQVIAKSLSIDSTFHNGNINALWKWIYVFLDRNNLSIRRVTRQGQKLSGHLNQVHEEVINAINERFTIGGTLSDVHDSLFVNMDETAVFYESSPTTTINAKGENTISIRCTGSNSKRMTVCVSCAYDGTKLPLFLVFKGKAGARIEKNLQNELGDGVIACCQEKGWMDERTSKIWIEKIWKPYVTGKGSSFLLLDEYKCHMQKSFVNSINDLGTEVDFIPGGYTCMLQPCDVGINKPLKNSFTNQYMKWTIDKYKDLGPGEKVKAPSRKEVADWITKAWEGITSETIQKTYKHIGYETKKERNVEIEEIIENVNEMYI